MKGHHLLRRKFNSKLCNHVINTDSVIDKWYLLQIPSVKFCRKDDYLVKKFKKYSYVPRIRWSSEFKTRLDIDIV